MKKELDDLTQALRNWPLKMWRPKDRSMTVYSYVVLRYVRFTNAAKNVSRSCHGEKNHN